MENSDSENQSPNISDLIPLGTATELSGLTQPHLALLIRKGVLWGTKLGGRDWFTTKQAILDYLATKPYPR